MSNERVAAVTSLAKRISHSNGKQWLMESDLSLAEITLLDTKFQGDDYALFAAIGDFTPREALTFRVELLQTHARILAEILKPSMALKLSSSELLEVCNRQKVKYGSAVEDPTLGHALIVRLKGDSSERRLAKTFPTRRFSHHSYSGAVQKLNAMVKPYKLELEQLAL